MMDKKAFRRENEVPISAKEKRELLMRVLETANKSQGKRYKFD